MDITETVSALCELLKGDPSDADIRKLLNPNLFDMSMAKINKISITDFEILFSKRTIVIVRAWNDQGGWENILIFEVSETPEGNRIIPSRTFFKEYIHIGYVDPWVARYVTVPPKEFICGA